MLMCSRCGAVVKRVWLTENQRLCDVCYPQGPAMEAGIVECDPPELAAGEPRKPSGLLSEELKLRLAEKLGECIRDRLAAYPPVLKHMTITGTVTLDPPPPRIITYCENAPPREVVESLIVRCGSGLVGGEPVMAPAIWTRQLRLEWERHEAFAKKIAAVICRGDDEMAIPMEPDRYGGLVRVVHTSGQRCCLCGGWIRTVQAKAKP